MLFHYMVLRSSCLVSMRGVLASLLVLSACLECCSSARILAVLPFPSRSHHSFMTSLLRTLATRGHHIVEYSPYPPPPRDNHTHHEIHTRFEQAHRYWTFSQLIAQMKDGRESSITGGEVRRLWSMLYPLCEDTFSHENIQKLLNSQEQFDLVLTESTFGQESMLVFGHKFSAPTVTVECFVPWSVLNRDAGNALSIASVPDLNAYLFSNRILSFKERMFNLIAVSCSLFSYHFSHIPAQERILKRYYNNSGTPPLSEMVSNVSLYLTNSHPAIVNFVQPYTPNIIPIGGININEGKSGISEDVLSFIDDAKRGFILFSLGTVVPADTMPKHTFEIFLNVFEKLPQKVLWKINYKEIPQDLPANIMIRKWLPQQDILAHPNCQLFITQGGLFSHQEALHVGVPTVSIPLISDQPYNAKYREVRGLGVTVDIVTLTEESLHSAITSVLNNPRYKETAVRLSHIYRDRPMSPADSAVFWVEYVLRHRGAAHLRPSSAHMPWYQLALLDVLAAIFTILILGLLAFYRIFKAVLSLMRKQTLTKYVPLQKKAN